MKIMNSDRLWLQRLGAEASDRLATKEEALEMILDLDIVVDAMIEAKEDDVAIMKIVRVQSSLRKFLEVDIWMHT